MSILFKNGTIVDYANKIEKKLDILVEGDKIELTDAKTKTTIEYVIYDFNTSSISNFNWIWFI